VDKDDQAIDRVSVIGERQNNVFDPLEVLMRADIGRSGLECFAGFHNLATIRPDLAWCFLALDFRKSDTRVVLEKVLAHMLPIRRYLKSGSGPRFTSRKLHAA